MSTPLLIAAVVGGGVLLLMRRLFPVQRAVKLLRYPADTMRGKTVIVTGANCGIGKALAGELLKLQARVVMACRDQQSAEEAAQDLKKQAGPEQGEVVIKHLDLASLRSVRKFCEEIIEVGPDLPGRSVSINGLLCLLCYCVAQALESTSRCFAHRIVQFKGQLYIITL